MPQAARPESGTRKTQSESDTDTDLPLSWAETALVVGLMGAASVVLICFLVAQWAGSPACWGKL